MIERFPVEEGNILAFRRAIGDPDPNPMVPSLTYVQAGAHFDPDDRLRPEPGEPWFEPAGLGSGSGAVTLHAEQHFEYHRPDGPGDVLSGTLAVGESWEKEGRSGRLVFTPTTIEYRNREGELVVTARSVAVATYQKWA
jgi:N-terminal half of MaoC dehydratase